MPIKYISEYDGEIVGGDSAFAFEAMMADLIGTGGTMILDNQEMFIKSLAGMYPATNAPLPTSIEGMFSTLRILTASNVNAFQFQNTACLIRNLIVRPDSFTWGKNDTNVDCGSVFWVNSAGPAKFENITFYALKGSDAIIRVGPVERVVLDTVDFAGCHGGNGILNVTHGASISVDNCQFWDFGNCGSVGQVNKQQNSGNIITGVANTAPLNGGSNFSRAVIKNSLFDEGYQKHIDLDGYHRVTIEDTGHKMPITNTGIGVHLKNVDQGVIKKVNIGAVNATTASHDRPLMKFQNCGKIVIIGLTNISRDESNQPNPQPNPRVERDSTTEVTLIDCAPEIQVVTV